MAENLGAKFTIDVTNLKAGLAQANRLIRESESEFRAAASGMDAWDKSQAGLEKRIQTLNDIAAVQQKKVEALKTEYKRLIDNGLDPASVKAIQLRTNINKEEEALNKSRAEIDKCSKAMDELGDESDETSKQIDNVSSSSKKAKDGFTVFKGVLADFAASALKNVVQGFKDVAKYSIDAYKAVDEGADAVIKQTGATGKAAKDLEDSYKAVASSIKADYTTIGNTLGQVNTRFGYTGEKLEDTTRQFIRFSSITGTDAAEAVRLVARALENSGDSLDDYSILLDKLARASQDSGVEVSTLTEGIVKHGAAMRELGFTTDEIIALFAQFEKSGVNTETAFKGLETAVKNWASEGKNSKEEFQKAMAEIEKAPTKTEKTQKAFEIFGKRAGTELADAISTGRFEYGKFVTDIQGSEGTVTDTYNTITDEFDDIDVALQKLDLAAADMTEKLKSKIAPAVTGAISGLSFAISSLPIVAESLLKPFGKVFEYLKSGFQGVANVVSTVFDKTLDLLNGVKEYNPPDVKAGFSGVVGELGDFIKANAPNAKYNLASAAAGINFVGSKIPKLAAGGVVSRATQAIIGEAGREAVIPLERDTGWIDILADKLGAKMSGGVTVNQTNNYSQAYSRYEMHKSQQDTVRAVKLALAR